MRKLIFLIALCFISIGQIFAQDVYEIKFTDPSGAKYKGLLVIFNESKMYMRVAYNAEGLYKVVNVEYTSEHVTDDDGTEFLVLVGSNPTFITAAGENGYNPDHLVFSDISELPFITDDPEDESKMLVADEFRIITSEDVTNEYLREFYLSTEDDYFALRKLFGLETKPKVNTNYSVPVTMHLVVVANTAIGDIGAGCEVDLRNLQTEFKGISQALNVPLKKYIVNGEDFVKENVLKTFEDMKVGSNDVVIFMYRGHGFRWDDQTDEWPMLDIRYNPYTRLSKETTVSLSEVYYAITKKGARFNVILADCCNNNVGISQSTNTTFLNMQANNNYNVDKLQDLFIKSKGNLLSCAASPGEYSWVNSANGGFYTVSFLQSLRDEISYLRSDKADWKDLMNNTVNGAKSKISNCKNCTAQNGRYYYGLTN